MRQSTRTQSRRPAARTTRAYPLAVATVLVPVTDYRLLDADFPNRGCPAIIQTECAAIRRKLAAAGGTRIFVRSDDLGHGFRVTVSAPRFVLDPQTWAVEPSARAPIRSGAVFAQRPWLARALMIWTR